MCHATAPADPVQSTCPRCGSEHVHIRGGHDFLVREIELEFEVP